MKKLNENLTVSASSVESVATEKATKKRVKVSAKKTDISQIEVKPAVEATQAELLAQAMKSLVSKPITNEVVDLFNMVLDLHRQGCTEAEILHNKNVFLLLKATPKESRAFLKPLLGFETELRAKYESEKASVLERLNALHDEALGFSELEKYWQTVGFFGRAVILSDIIKEPLSYVELYLCASFAETVASYDISQGNKVRYLKAYSETFRKYEFPISNASTRVLNNSTDDKGLLRKYSELVAGAKSLNRKTMCSSYLLQAYCFTSGQTYYPVTWVNENLYNACKRNNSGGRTDFLPTLKNLGLLEKSQVWNYIYNCDLSSVDFDADTAFEWQAMKNADKRNDMISTIWDYICIKAQVLQEKAFKAPKGTSSKSSKSNTESQKTREPELVITDDMLADLL